MWLADAKSKKRVKPDWNLTEGNLNEISWTNKRDKIIKVILQRVFRFIEWKKQQRDIKIIDSAIYQMYTKHKWTVSLEKWKQTNTKIRYFKEFILTK